jgi:hypothetical protein
VSSEEGTEFFKTLLRSTFGTKGKFFATAGVQKAVGLACNTTLLEPGYAAVLATM